MNCERKNNCLTGRTWWIRMNSPCKIYETVYGHKTVSFWNFTFWIYASLEELSVHSTAIFLKAAGVESVHSQHRERDFSSSISRLFQGKFLMLTLIEFRFPFCLFFFSQFFLERTVLSDFPPFGIALLRLWVTVTWNQHKQHSLLSSQASLRFGNIEKINFGMNCRDKRIIGL